MNISLLPQELQNLISEFNIEHRPKMKLVFKELIVNHQGINYNNISCRYCRFIPDENYTKYILYKKKYKKYKFCSEWCRFNYSFDLMQ